MRACGRNVTVNYFLISQFGYSKEPSLKHMLKLMDKKIVALLRCHFCLTGHMNCGES